MKVNKVDLINSLKDHQNTISPLASLRTTLLLEELVDQALQWREEEVSLQEVLQLLVTLADREPAIMISNLLTSIDPNNEEQWHMLEEGVFTKAQSFIRDYIKVQTQLKPMCLGQMKSEKQPLSLPEMGRGLTYLHHKEPS